MCNYWYDIKTRFRQTVYVFNLSSQLLANQHYLKLSGTDDYTCAMSYTHNLLQKYHTLMIHGAVMLKVQLL